MTLPPPNHPFAIARYRVPLIRRKSLRTNLREHGFLKDYLKKHQLNPASKYFPEAADMLATQPLENYMDVSARRAAGGSPDSPGGAREGLGVLEDGQGL